MILNNFFSKSPPSIKDVFDREIKEGGLVYLGQGTKYPMGYSKFPTRFARLKERVLYYCRSEQSVVYARRRFRNGTPTDTFVSSFKMSDAYVYSNTERANDDRFRDSSLFSKCFVIIRFRDHNNEERHFIFEAESAGVAAIINKELSEHVVNKNEDMLREEKRLEIAELEAEYDDKIRRAILE